MNILCAFSQFNYGDRARGQSHEFSHFIPALCRLGNSIDHFETRDRSGSRGFADLNRALLERVERTKPDVIIAAQTHYELWSETWDIIRTGSNCATVNWATDDSWKYSQFSRFLAPSFHAVATTCPASVQRYANDGISQVLLTQWACDSGNLLSPLPAAQCCRKISFVGTATRERRAWIADLAKRGVHVDCFGHGWPHGPVDGSVIRRIVRESVISLNFSGNRGIFGHRQRQLKARTFEVPGAGGFLLTEDADGLDRYFTPGMDVATFRSLDELQNQIDHFTNDVGARDDIARSGHARAAREHTYEQRLADVLEFACARRDAAVDRTCTAPAPTIDWSRYEEAERRYARATPLRGVLQPIELLCQACWGPVRGRRAFRRILFETCWRLDGASVYSASGLPGRLFYDVS